MTQADKYAELAMTADRYNPAGKCYSLSHCHVYFCTDFGFRSVTYYVLKFTGKLGSTHLARTQFL